MKRFEDCVIHPRQQNGWDGNGENCPIGKNDCADCKHCNYIGTLGGEYYIECRYDESEEAEMDKRLDDFSERYCRYCGTQRCLGCRDEEWREGCKAFREELGDLIKKQ